MFIISFHFKTYKITIFISSNRYHLKDAALKGTLPAIEACDGILHAFEYIAKDARIHNLFNQTMHNHTTIVMKKIIEIYKEFEGLNQLLDVAGGLGATLRVIIDKYPQIKGINFDLPHVIKDAPCYPGKHNMIFYTLVTYF